MKDDGNYGQLGGSLQWHSNGDSNSRCQLRPGPYEIADGASAGVGAQALVVRRIAYWSRPAGLEQDRLSDLSPFLRVGVRGGQWGGAWGLGGEGVDEGPIVWEGLRGRR